MEKKMEEGLIQKQVDQEHELSASKAVKQFLQQTPSFWESVGTLSVVGGFFLYVLSGNCANVMPAAVAAIVLITMLNWVKLFRVRVLNMKPSKFASPVVGFVLSLLPQLLMEKKLSAVGIWMLWLLYIFSALQAMRFRANGYLVCQIAAVLVSNSFLPEVGLLKWVVSPALFLNCIILVWLNDWLAEMEITSSTFEYIVKGLGKYLIHLLRLIHI